MISNIRPEHVCRLCILDYFQSGFALLVARTILLYDRFFRPAFVERRKEETSQMKVVVDQKLCEGNMKCQEAAPEVFEVRDDDKSHLLIDNPPERMRDKLKLAARLCPRQAIT